MLAISELRQRDNHLQLLMVVRNDHSLTRDCQDLQHVPTTTVRVVQSATTSIGALEQSAHCFTLLNSCLSFHVVLQFELAASARVDVLVSAIGPKQASQVVKDLSALLPLEQAKVGCVQHTRCLLSIHTITLSVKSKLAL